MTKNLVKFDLKSSFLSCEKDTDTILRKLFIESRPYSDMLKRLLVISTKDCLDNETSELYKKKIQEASVKKLIDDGYIQLFPKLRLPENEEVKSYIFITFDNFVPNGTNPEYLDINDYTIEKGIAFPVELHLKGRISITDFHGGTMPICLSDAV